MSTHHNSLPFDYGTGDALCTAAYLDKPILDFCRRVQAQRILDLGCGNGAFCGVLKQAGLAVTGCDPSAQGIAFARKNHPEIPFHEVGVYDDPSGLDGQPFDVVVACEVIEHLYQPRALARFAAAVLRPGGYLVLTTPYHGYLKNLLLSLGGKWDQHWNPLWDGGHIKFWSRTTLSQLMRETGFEVQHFIGAGRFPYLWKSMILISRKSVG